MDHAIDRGTMGDLAGWPSAIHTELGDCRLPPRMVVARWRARLDPRAGHPFRQSRLSPRWRPRGGFLGGPGLHPAIGVPVVLLGLVIRHRLPLL